MKVYGESSVNFNGHLRFINKAQLMKAPPNPNMAAKNIVIKDLLINTDEIKEITKLKIDTGEFAYEIGVRDCNSPVFKSIKASIESFLQRFSVIKLVNNESYKVEVPFERLSRLYEMLRLTNETIEA